ncbi:MAG: amidohydrolase [Anaerolineales bacterium]|nr:amidohydrolase [Anaerolineales bacterium]
MRTILLTNARIYPLSRPAAEQPAEALAVMDGRVLAVGSETECRAAAAQPDVVDCGGRAVIPGLIDAHMHMELTALARRAVAAETPTLAECLARVAAAAEQTPPGEWITGQGWNQNDWGGDFPTAADLDAVAPRHPVFLQVKSAHAAWVNSAALRAAGLTADTPDPDGGRILRDARGRPTGILLETAMTLVANRIPPPTEASLAGLYDEMQVDAWRWGLTGVHDFDGRRSLAAWQKLRERGELGLRVVKTVRAAYLEHARALGLRPGFGDGWIRLGQVKVFLDGALGPRTAWMLAPYVNEPDNVGVTVTDPEELLDIGRRAAQAGFALTVHAIGDRANQEVLNVFERLIADVGRPTALPHRTEHVQIAQASDLARLGRLGVIASMQPLHATSDGPSAERLWGHARSAGAYAWRTVLAGGATLAFGSDSPIETLNPWTGVHAAVTRRRADGWPGPDGWFPDQRLSVAEALLAYTRGAALAGGMVGRTEGLVPGALADLCVLDRDPFACEPEALPQTTAVATLVGGTWRRREI